VEKIAYACHTAYLDPITGCGLLVRPLPEDDMGGTDLGQSLQEADWNTAMRDLFARGWEPSMDEDGLGFALDSELPDGREVVGLYGRESVVDQPSMEQIAESFAELRRLAGSVG
jgi:hypothetical protein